MLCGIVKKQQHNKTTHNCWFCWGIVSLIRLCLIWDEAALGAARKRFAGSNSRYPLLPRGAVSGGEREAPGPGAGTSAVARLPSDFMNVYYQIRSSQLDRSIKGLKEHFRKSSSSSGVPYSPAIPNKRKDTPTKKPVKRPGEPPTAGPPQNHPKGHLGPGLPRPTPGRAAPAPVQLVLTVPLTTGTRDRKQVSAHPAKPGPVSSFLTSPGAA